MNPGIVAAAALAGVLSGMAAGGGTILVPVLVVLFGIAQHQAQGAVLAAFLVIQSVAVVGQWRQGNVRLRPALWMVMAAAAGAVAGGLIAGGTRPVVLRQIYGWYLILLGAANWLPLGGERRAPETGGPVLIGAGHPRGAGKRPGSGEAPCHGNPTSGEETRS